MFDANYGAVYSFAEFLYLGTVKRLDEYVEKFFVLADKY
jgi:hypothetical protein